MSAPAGFGKTTLLADWLAAGPARRAVTRSAAWLSLDPGDNDPASFWTYVIAALQTVAPEIGAERAGAAAGVPAAADRDGTDDPAQRPRCRARAMSCWCSTTTTSSTPRECSEAMAFLLDHLPPRLHLVIASRADPPLPLARLRARGELVEVRAADLRFTPGRGCGVPQRGDGPGADGRRTSPRWRGAPRAGSPRSSWRRSRCRGATTSPASSPASPATTATSSTTWSRRCCSASPTRCRPSCCRPPSSTG